MSVADELATLVREQFAHLRGGVSDAMRRRLEDTERTLLGVIVDEAAHTDEVARDNLRLQRRVEELEELLHEDGPGVPRGGDLGWASGR